MLASRPLQKNFYLWAVSMAGYSPVHASTLGNVDGPAGWAKLLALLMIPGIGVVMLALPFLLASRMKGAGAAKITMYVLFLEALSAGTAWLFIYFVFF